MHVKILQLLHNLLALRVYVGITLSYYHTKA